MPVTTSIILKKNRGSRTLELNLNFPLSLGEHWEPFFRPGAKSPGDGTGKLNSYIRRLFKLGENILTTPQNGYSKGVLNLKQILQYKSI